MRNIVQVSVDSGFHLETVPANVCQHRHSHRQRAKKPCNQSGDMARETLSPSLPGQTDAAVAAKYDEENTVSDERLSDFNPQPTLTLGRHSNPKRTKA